MTRPVPPPRPDELEGYLRGVERRIAEAEVPPDAATLAVLEEGRRALAAGDYATADARLRAVDAALDRDRPQIALREWPRGLVAVNGPGVETDVDDPDGDPIANRLRLVQRLLAVRVSQGWSADAVVTMLRSAEAALAAGDRTRARSLVDAAHARLDPSRER